MTAVGAGETIGAYRFTLTEEYYMAETVDPLIVPLQDMDRRIEDWRAVPQTPEQAVAQEAIDKAAKRLSTPPFSWGGSVAPDPSSPENEADAERTLDESLDYGPKVPPHSAPTLAVWRVQLGEQVAYVGEVRHTETLYLAALTAAEALAAAALVIAHPDTPYPASLAPSNARALPLAGGQVPSEDDRQDPGPL